MASEQVIVVGGGLAGLSCAHTVLERGGRVLLLDKSSFLGGNSTKATSGINGAGTNTQADLGVADSAKIFYEDTLKSARDLARPPMIKVCRPTLCAKKNTRSAADSTRRAPRLVARRVCSARTLFSAVICERAASSARLLFLFFFFFFCHFF